jgi:Beta-ketoacyl synthase, N-terminal domain
VTSSNWLCVPDTYTVFTSSGGSGEIIHQICESLASAERDVSPTRFHNSVHNAPAGYWGVATRNEWPSTSLCAYDASFAAGLLEAIAQARMTAQPVLLLAYDLRYPEPLNSARRISDAFSMALLLSATARAAAQFSLDVDIATPDAISTPMNDIALEQFRRLNPAARSLPLLVALAARRNERIFIESTNGAQLEIQVNVVNQ